MLAQPEGWQRDLMDRPFEAKATTVQVAHLKRPGGNAGHVRARHWAVVSDRRRIDQGNEKKLAQTARESDKKNPTSGLSRCQLQTAVDRQWNDRADMNGGRRRKSDVVGRNRKGGAKRRKR